MDSFENIPKVTKRKLMASGSSVVLTVPREWLEENHLKVGQDVIMVMNGSLNFMNPTEANITKIRNHLSHATRPDEELNGRECKSPSKLRDTKASDSK